MKKPALKDLRYDKTETRNIRSDMRKPHNMKITFNIDLENLIQLRQMTEQTGVPYQRLVNKLLKEGLGKISSTESRLEKLEKELKNLRKKLAA